MFVIDREKCTDCGECRDVCPCEAIEERDGCCEVVPDLCAECGACMDVCEFGAIEEREIPSRTV
ncbi:MAG: 4Fe-4S binding protein [Succinivibrionaceae bacterium]|nr:4Fe-4S binding protein [Succinivibrionaceae bacterium]